MYSDGRAINLSNFCGISIEKLKIDLLYDPAIPSWISKQMTLRILQYVIALMTTSVIFIRTKL